MQKIYSYVAYFLVIALVLWSIIFRTLLVDFASIICRYGFADWQSNLAVRICGNDVEQCLDWLLRNSSSMQADMRAKREEIMVGIIDLTCDLSMWLIFIDIVFSL